MSIKTFGIAAVALGAGLSVGFCSGAAGERGNLAEAHQYALQNADKCMSGPESARSDVDGTHKAELAIYCAGFTSGVNAAVDLSTPS